MFIRQTPAYTPTLTTDWAIHRLTREHREANACDNISRVLIIPLLKQCQARCENLRQKLFDSNLFFKRLTTIFIIVRKTYFRIIAMSVCVWCAVLYIVHDDFVLFCSLPICLFFLSHLLLSLTPSVFLTRCECFAFIIQSTRARICGYLIYALPTKNSKFSLGSFSRCT